MGFLKKFFDDATSSLKDAVDQKKNEIQESFSWMMRYRCSGMGNIRALTMHKGEIILCSD